MAYTPSALKIIFGISILTSCVARCPKDWAEFGTDCLMFSYDRHNWHDAQIACRKDSAVLLMDDSQAKHMFIRQLLSVLDGERIRNFFIGASDQVFEGQWRWLKTGLPLGDRFTAWAPGQPSTNDTIANKNNCMMMTWVDNDIFWSDWDCNDRSAHHICERPISTFTNSPPIIG